jgi:hypothetical protein
VSTSFFRQNPQIVILLWGHDPAIHAATAITGR